MKLREEVFDYIKAVNADGLMPGTRAYTGTAM